MAWHANILYGQATPRLLACLAADPVLGPALHHLREVEHRWPRGVLRHGLPPGGLLAVRDLGAPDDRHEVEVPWDALFGASGPKAHFSAPALLQEHGLDPRAWPPAAALGYVKHLAHRAGEPLSLYRCEMWGGDVDLEVTWLPGWAPGEPDRVIFHVEPGQVATAVGRRVTLEAGDTLRRTLEFHRLRLPSGYFAPHAGLFDWERWRVRPRAAGPERALGVESEEPPRPPVPRSLFRCVELGDREGAAAVLAAGADPNAYAYEGPLERAASLGRADLVELLLRAGARAVPEGRLGALDGAADVACVELLVAAGAEIDPSGSEFFPPLVRAAREGRDAVARWLVERGASVRPAGHEHAVFVAACEGGLAWLVERALAAGVAVDCGEYGDSGRSGLALAAGRGRAEVVRLLLARGAKLSEETWYGACAGGSLELIEEHLARGQEVEAAVHGSFGLMIAARAGQGAAVRRLLAGGADPSRIFCGESAVHAAAWAGSPAAVEALLEREPEALDRRSDTGWTPLFAAVWRGHREVAALLVAAGASRDGVDEQGRSLRAEAARRGVPLGE